MYKKSGDSLLVASNSHAKIWSVPVVKDRIRQEPFLVVERKDSVMICVQNEWDEILFVRQHRFAGDVCGWELPQGAVEIGETPKQAAARELLEETGYVAEDGGDTEGSVYEAVDWCTAQIHIVRFREIHLMPGAKADLETKWMAEREWMHFARTRRIFDAASLSALLFVSHRSNF